jgi:hypothetical protein
MCFCQLGIGEVWGGALKGGFESLCNSATVEQVSYVYTPLYLYKQMLMDKDLSMIIPNH